MVALSVTMQLINRQAKGNKEHNFKMSNGPKFDPGAIDTGPAAPQIALKVWKGERWRITAIAIPALGFVLVGAGIFVLISGGGREAATGVGAMLAGLAFFGMSVPLWVFGRGELRAGFDGRTNTLWVRRPGRELAWEADADKISGFNVNQRLMDAGQVLTEHGYKSNVKVRYEVVATRAASAHPMPVSGCIMTTQKEARMLAEGLEGLRQRR